MRQTSDFLDESAILHGVLQHLDEANFEQETLFKNWTINDILVHLHFWNTGADLALNQPDEFDAMTSKLLDAIKAGNLRPHENHAIPERGHRLLEVWYKLTKKLADDFSVVDPKARLKWVGPTMSARTCISARQMEVWAHGQAVFDLLGKDRPEGERILNVIILGINAFAWSHQVHGLPVPKTMPKLALISPCGEEWCFGEETAGHIIGSAVEFAQVVTQTRNIADTGLNVSGDIAEKWMKNAQCFAGPPEKPPAPGKRKRSEP